MSSQPSPSPSPSLFSSLNPALSYFCLLLSCGPQCGSTSIYRRLLRLPLFSSTNKSELNSSDTINFSPYRDATQNHYRNANYQKIQKVKFSLNVEKDAMIPTESPNTLYVMDVPFHHLDILTTTSTSSSSSFHLHPLLDVLHHFPSSHIYILYICDTPRSFTSIPLWESLIKNHLSPSSPPVWKFLLINKSDLDKDNNNSNGDSVMNIDAKQWDDYSFVMKKYHIGCAFKCSTITNQLLWSAEWREEGEIAKEVLMTLTAPSLSSTPYIIFSSHCCYVKENVRRWMNNNNNERGEEKDGEGISKTQEDNSLSDAIDNIPPVSFLKDFLPFFSAFVAQTAFPSRFSRGNLTVNINNNMSENNVDNNTQHGNVNFPNVKTPHSKKGGVAAPSPSPRPAVSFAPSPSPSSKQNINTTDEKNNSNIPSSAYKSNQVVPVNVSPDMSTGPVSTPSDEKGSSPPMSFAITVSAD